MTKKPKIKIQDEPGADDRLLRGVGKALSTPLGQDRNDLLLVEPVLSHLRPFPRL
ncbi:MAG: hypothetical protein JNM89_08715 [Hyphomicrobiaceae bacterium]|nr:hypothetical protein [Hyphomicrobiaceae bacterium]